MTVNIGVKLDGDSSPISTHHKESLPVNRGLLARFSLLALVAVVAAAGADDPLPRFPPREPAEALRSFTLQGGFRLDLLAAEPLVMDPVAAAYDEDGRLYVVEMSDYPHVEIANDKPFTENLGDPPIGRVRLLIDRDGDGVFDEGRIFADKLSWPTGIVAWKGGVFVAATPDVWYLKDTDGDHLADERRRVFTGFRKFNVQAVMNNLQWGLDHRIYGAGSSNGGTIRPVGQGEAAGVDVLRRDFRFDPATSRFEAISGGARFGNTFDDWGNRFLCDIRNPAQHVVLPARYLARNPVLPTPRALHDAAEGGDGVPLFRISPPEPWRALRARRWAAVGKAVPRSELVAAGFLTSSSGITFYRGDAYPEAYRGNLFLGEVANNLVHRMTVEPFGVTFRARRADASAEFVASTDTWFRPVNFVNAPDGTLHVLDMYRETIEHPWSIPDDILNRLNLRSGEDRGRIYRLAPPGFQHRATPRLGRASVPDLVRLLEHPNGWHRETAHRLLHERQDKAAVPLLKGLVRESKDPRGRLLALYSLEGLGALGEDDLRAGLLDGSPHVREHAVLLTEPRLGPGRASSLKAEVVRLADDPSARVRFQVAFTLGEIACDEVARGLAAIARRDAGDPWVRTALLSSATADPAGLFEPLWSDRAFAASEHGEALLRPLALVIGARGKREEIRRIVSALAGGGPDEPALGVTIGLGDGLARAGRKLSDLQADLTPAAATWLDRLFARASALASDESAAPGRRAQGVALLGQGRFDQARATLPTLLNSGQPAEVQSAAARALAAFDQPEVAEVLLRYWKGYTPALRAEVVGLLLGRRGWIDPLLSAVEGRTVPSAQIPPTRRALLLKDRDPKIRERAQRLLGGDAPGPRSEAVARYKPALDRPGDPDRGALVFDRECMVCHQLGARGHAVGPNLAGVRRRTAEEILVNILDPNRDVAPEFLEYTIALDDGRVVTGLVAAETPGAVTLRGREGVEQTILRRNVAELASTGKSLMPEALENSVTPQEMTDLIGFLLKIQD
jgi:putative membrane-bound dehydrogenase-like protein